MTLAIETVLRFLGLFYVLSGIVVVRTLAASGMADATYAAIMGTAPSRAERLREVWLGVGSVLIGLGGLALALLLDAAAVLFVLAAAQQGAYLLVVAPRCFDPADPPDPAGRAKTRNAAIVYGIVTALVVAAAGTGLLRPWHELPGWLAAAAAVAALAGIGWAAWALGLRDALGKVD